jgi:dihydroorotase
VTPKSVRPHTVLLQGGRVVDPSQDIDQTASVFIEGGCIASIFTKGAEYLPQAELTIDATGLVVTPGFVDIHAHLRYPGTADKETIASGTASAIRGGFTTVCAMANSDPPVDSGPRVEQVLDMVSREARCHVHTFGAVSVGLRGKQSADAADLVSAGAVALSDDGNPIADEALMRSTLRASERLGVAISVHEETREPVAGGSRACWACPGEVDIIRRDLDLVRLTGGRLHVAHVSCAESVALIADAQASGLAITAEATPHHLLLTSAIREETELLPPGHGNSKVNPPLRSDTDVAAIQEGVRSGVITAIATDHAPHSVWDKAGGLQGAAFGLTGFEVALPLILQLVAAGLLSLSTGVERLTTGPALSLGLKAGDLKPGSRADVCLFDPLATWQPGRDTIVSKGKNSPLTGATLTGRVAATIVAGTIHGFGADHGLRAIRAT